MSVANPQVTAGELKPCPFCGCTELWADVDSAQSFAVQCRNQKCRAKIARYTPGKWPKGVWQKGLTGDQNIDRLYQWTLDQCIKAWNRRPKQRQPKQPRKGTRGPNRRKS